MEREGLVQSRERKRERQALFRAGLALLWLMVVAGWSVGITTAVFGSPAGGAGDATRGRSLFNGKGVCLYCHGLDAHPDRLPQLAPETAAYIAHLDPKPPHLREALGLKIAGDKERFQLIREGHVGTGMLPDVSLSDQDIHDLLAYLATLRSPAATKGESHR
ncbi:MAG: c-type cytochrome [Nitrospirae bacterium]|nr:MAG: c-type cytochrome [Nitrospirota bacterium]